MAARKNGVWAKISAARKSGFWGNISRAATITACTAGVFIGAIYLFQNKMLYHPRHYEDHGYGSYYHDNLSRFNELLRKLGRPSMEAISYQVPEISKTEHRAWYIPPKEDTGTERGALWIVSGGNAMLALDWIDFIGKYVQHSEKRGNEDISFLLIDYPGYGLNSRDDLFPNPENILLSTKAAVRKVLGQSTRAPVLRILGHSLGCAASLQLAADEEFRDELGEAGSVIDRAVLSAPFASLLHMARQMFTSLIPRALIQHEWDNLDAISRFVSNSGSVEAQYNLSITILHGTADGLIPIEQGRTVHRVASEAAKANSGVAVSTQFIALPGLDHNDVLMHAEQQIMAGMNGETMSNNKL